MRNEEPKLSESHLRSFVVIHSYLWDFPTNRLHACVQNDLK